MHHPHPAGTTLGHQNMDERQLEEVPWQLAEMRACRLVELLSDLPFLAGCGSLSEQDVKTYWARIRTSSTFRLPDAYKGVLEHPSAHDEYVPMIATLLQSALYHAEALSAWRVSGSSPPAKRGQGPAGTVPRQPGGARIRG